MTHKTHGTEQLCVLIKESARKARYEKILYIMKKLEDSQLSDPALVVDVTKVAAPMEVGETRGSFNPATFSINLNVRGTTWNVSELVASTFLHEILHAYFYCLKNNKLSEQQVWKRSKAEVEDEAVALFREEIVVNCISYYYRGLRGKRLADAMREVAIRYGKTYMVNYKTEVETFLAENEEESSLKKIGLEIYREMGGTSFDGK